MTYPEGSQDPAAHQQPVAGEPQHQDPAYGAQQPGYAPQAPQQPQGPSADGGFPAPGEQTWPSAPYGTAPYATPQYSGPQYGSPPQGATPSGPRAPLPLGLISAALGVLALIFSFFPWISLKVDLGSASELLTSSERSLVHDTLDKLYVNAWDLRWATRSVLLAMLAAGLAAAPAVDRRLRSHWTLGAAVLASAGATVLMIVQIVNRTGIYGRAVDVFSDLMNSDNQFSSQSGVDVSLGLRWGAIATAVVVFAQCAVLVVLWLQSRPADAPAEAPAEAPEQR